MIAWVSWDAHVSSVMYRGKDVDRPAGIGALLGFVSNEDHPSAVVVVGTGDGADRKIEPGAAILVIRLSDLRYEETPA